MYLPSENSLNEYTIEQIERIENNTAGVLDYVEYIGKNALVLAISSLPVLTVATNFDSVNHPGGWIVMAPLVAGSVVLGAGSAFCLADGVKQLAKNIINRAGLQINDEQLEDVLEKLNKESERGGSSR